MSKTNQIKVGPNFMLSEFAVSDSYPTLAEQIRFSTAGIAKVRMLVTLHLQPVRDQFGRVLILSGKRSEALNKAVGGSESSDHLYSPGNLAAAVDFVCPNASMAEVYQFLRIRGPHCYGQLIYYTQSNFIHVSLPEAGRRVGESWEWAK